MYIYPAKCTVQTYCNLFAATRRLQYAYHCLFFLLPNRVLHEHITVLQYWLHISDILSKYTLHHPTPPICSFFLKCMCFLADHAGCTHSHTRQRGLDAGLAWGYSQLLNAEPCDFKAACWFAAVRSCYATDIWTVNKVGQSLWHYRQEAMVHVGELHATASCTGWV